MAKAHDTSDVIAGSHEAFDEVDGNDEHLRIFGKNASELRYSDVVCQFCMTRIDEIGWCGCDTIGGG